LFRLLISFLIFISFLKTSGTRRNGWGSNLITVLGFRLLANKTGSGTFNFTNLLKIACLRISFFIRLAPLIPILDAAIIRSVISGLGFKITLAYVFLPSGVLGTKNILPLKVCFLMDGKGKEPLVHRLYNVSNCLGVLLFM